MDSVKFYHFLTDFGAYMHWGVPTVMQFKDNMLKVIYFDGEKTHEDTQALNRVEASYYRWETEGLKNEKTD